MTNKIYLDAGHGGTDGGAGGNGLLEKNLTLSIVKKIQETLTKNYEDVQIKLSRTGDTYPTLSQRTNDANVWGADVLVSVHINANANTSANGFETYIYNQSPSARTVSFQNMLHQEIFNQMKAGGVSNDRGKKRANLHMCRESNMSAVLTENLFISNKADADKLRQDAFINRIAQGHVVGLEKFLGLKKKQTAEPNTSTPIDTSIGVRFAVQVGSFASRANAEAMLKRVQAEGFEAFIKEQ